MKYFLYKKFPNNSLEYVEEHEKFKTAKKSANELRKHLTVADNCEIKMICAQNQKVAVELLSEVREAPPMMDD